MGKSGRRGVIYGDSSAIQRERAASLVTDRKAISLVSDIDLQSPSVVRKRARGAARIAEAQIVARLVAAVLGDSASGILPMSNIENITATCQ